MKYGSFRDGLDYGWWGECFHPHYHGGPPDGIRDHVSVKKAAVKAANRALSDQDCGETSRDFRFGFQQAYIDIANGGSGALPAVPPARYWTAAYRTTWGHNKAREWFSGYEAGASSAQCCMPASTLSVPTSVYRACDSHLAVGLEAHSSAAPPMVNATQNWSGGAAYSPSPIIDSRYGPMPTPFAPQPAATYPTLPSFSPAPTAPVMSPMLPAPNSNSLPGGGWSSGPSPALPPASPPTFTAPSTPTPDSAGGGHSIPLPAPSTVPAPSSTVTPMHGVRDGHSMSNPHSLSNPWTRYSGMNGFGFRPEGASR